MGGRQLSATDYFALPRQWAALRARWWRASPTSTRCWCRPPLSSRPLAEVDATGSYGQHNGRYLRNTAVGNILNLCAVTLPCGFTRAGSPSGS